MLPLCLIVLQPAPVAEYKLLTTPIAQVDDRLFGFFMERPSWGGETGVEAAVVPGTHRLQPKVVRLLRDLHIPVMRFPGGTDIDFIDWTNMIDLPGRQERPVTIGHQGGKVTNRFGYDEFLGLCDDLHCQAILPVRFRDGLLGLRPLVAEAKKAAQLVAYANGKCGDDLSVNTWPNLRARHGRRRPYHVGTFQIGNETWAFMDELRARYGSGAAQRYVDALKVFVSTMRKADPAIRIIADDPDHEVAKLIRQQLGNRIDALVDHYYAPWEIGDFKLDSQVYPIGKLTQKEAWNAWVSTAPTNPVGQALLTLRGLSDRPEHGYPLAITEWNWVGWWKDAADAPLDSLWAKGVGAAGMLNSMIRHAAMIKIACMSGVIGQAWQMEAIQVRPDASRTPYLVPAGQVVGLYSRFHGKSLLPVQTVDVPTFSQPYSFSAVQPSQRVQSVDLVATAGPNALYLHAVNRSFDTAIDLVLDASGLPHLTTRAIVHTLTGRLINAPNPGQELSPATESEREIEVTLPRMTVRLAPRTVSVIEVRRH